MGMATTHTKKTQVKKLTARHMRLRKCSKSIELKRMIDLDGSLIARDISIEEDDIVQEEPFARDPDEEDFEDYTGNAGASATHFYHDTVRGVQIRAESRLHWLSPDL